MMICPKCHQHHSLKLKNTKTYDCGITIVGTKWDTSTNAEDRMFCFEKIDDSKDMEAAMSLCEHLTNCGFFKPMVAVGNPYYGKWWTGVLEVNGEGNEAAIPLWWDNHPVFTGKRSDDYQEPRVYG